MEYINALNLMQKKQSLGIKPGLCRIKKLLEKMGNPQNNLKIIHIAGTNGKGTVASNIANALTQNGKKTGLFTSPPVVDYTEQIQIDSRFIPKDRFAFYVQKYIDEDVTEFELLTAIMFKYFDDEKVDFAVVECGMGGEGDSTNVSDKTLISIITAVSLDHTDFLGNSIEEIAKQKSGIIKKDSTLILYPNDVNYIFVERAKQVGSRYIEIREHGDCLKNDYAIVSKVLEILGFDTKFEKAKLPARLEYIRENVLLDGSHNPQAAHLLKASLPKDKNITAIIGMMKDKNIDEYLSIVSPMCKKIIVTKPSNPRSADTNTLAMSAKKYCNSVEIIENPFDAIKIKDYEFLLICGSFYLAGDIYNSLAKI